MNYEYLTIEDAEKLARKEISEQIAVEYINQLNDRKILTDLEVRLSNELIKTIDDLKNVKKLLEEGEENESN